MTTTNFSAGTVVASTWLNDVDVTTYEGCINVRQAPYNAVGDGSTDDTAAIQAAITAAAAARKPLYFPPNASAAYYKVTSTLTITTALSIIGSGSYTTTILGVGLGAGVRVIDYNCLAADVIEQVNIRGITIRSDNASPNALRLKNVSYVWARDLRVYNVANGIEIEGTRCFTHTYDGLNGTSVTTSTYKFASGFTGGGQYIFNGCTFVGTTAFALPATASADGLNFFGCNWEQATTNSMFIGGSVGGLLVSGGRTEGCDGIDFVLRPFGAAEVIGGVSISGVSFGSSDAAASSRIRIGGDSGKVRGFSVLGNTVTHGTDTFAGTLVDLNGEGGAGIVAGNYLHGTACTVVNNQRAGIVVYSNENLSGALAEWWGTAHWGVTESSYTVTTTGHTVAQTGTINYTLHGNVGTLKLPTLSGTSSATSFTITGMPAAIRPATDTDIILKVADNGGAALFALGRIKTTGVIEVYATPGGGVFTAAGAKTCYALSVSYNLT